MCICNTIRTCSAHRQPRNWNREPHDSGAISVGMDGLGQRRVTMINPGSRGDYLHLFVLWFDAYGATRLHVYADNIEDALDECVDWIADHAPGLLADDAVFSEYTRLLEERKENGDDTSDESVQEACQVEAEVDTTIAGNSGHFLHSREWGIVFEDPTATQLYHYISGV